MCEYISYAYAKHYGISDIAVTKLEEKDGLLTGRVGKDDA